MPGAHLSDAVCISRELLGSLRELDNDTVGQSCPVEALKWWDIDSVSAANFFFFECRFD